MNLSLLIGQTSDFNTVSFLIISSHLHNKRSIVCSLVPQGHVGVSIILIRCKYDLILPCPVTMDVKSLVMFMFVFNLSAITGKYSFVIPPFFVWSHSFCHFSTLISPSILITTLFGTSLQHSLMPTSSCFLLCECVDQFVFLYPDVNLDPAELYFPVFSHLRQFLSYFFNQENVNVAIFKRVQCHSTVCAYDSRLVFSLQVFFILQFFHYRQVLGLIVGASFV